MFYDEDLNKSLIYILTNDFSESIIADTLIVVSNLFVTNDNIKKSFMKKNLVNIIFSIIFQSNSNEVIYHCISFLEFYVDIEDFNKKIKFIHDKQIFQVFLYVLKNNLNEKVILSILVNIDSILYKLVNNNKYNFNEELFYYIKDNFLSFIENLKNKKNGEISLLSESIMIEYFDNLNN